MKTSSLLDKGITVIVVFALFFIVGTYVLGSTLFGPSWNRRRIKRIGDLVRSEPHDGPGVVV